jgi:cytochrome c oxidase subunit 2
VGAGFRHEEGRDPGYINELWFKADKVGTYRGQCAELCGRDHGFMPIVVEVASGAYDAWLAAQKAARQAAAADRPAAAAATRRARAPDASRQSTVLVADAE